MRRIMIDYEKCVGCGNCQLACMQAHSKEIGSIYTLDLTSPQHDSRNHILKNDKGEYIPLFCRHCEEPECVITCVSGAMSKDMVSGHVFYDEDICAKCFMCVMNCPYGVLKPDKLSNQKVVKCDFCIEIDYDPHCVKACPTHAIYVREV